MVEVPIVVHSGSASAAHSTWRSLGLLDFCYIGFGITKEMMGLLRNILKLQNMPRTQDIEKYTPLLDLSWKSVGCDGRFRYNVHPEENFLGLA